MQIWPCITYMKWTTCMLHISLDHIKFFMIVDWTYMAIPWTPNLWHLLSKVHACISIYGNDFLQMTENWVRTEGNTKGHCPPTGYCCNYWQTEPIYYLLCPCILATLIYLPTKFQGAPISQSATVIWSLCACSWAWAAWQHSTAHNVRHRSNLQGQLAWAKPSQGCCLFEAGMPVHIVGAIKQPK